MKHLGTMVLETPRLILRPFTMEDAAAMYANWASDENVTRYMAWPRHETPEDTQKVLERWVQQYENPAFYEWAIVLRELKQPIGNIEVLQIDDYVQKVNLGYSIGQAFWGKGIMPEALRAVIGFLLDEVEANRVEACHDSRNPNSGKVMRKCGMIYEGTFRQWAWTNAGICDTCNYGILKSDSRRK